MLSFGDFLPSLHKKALFLNQKNWSLIPLLGDLRPDIPKAPALRQWALYQSRLPTPKEIKHWFLDCGYQAIGIVLGRISNLVVIDIDDSKQADKFSKLFPDLLDTLTIESGNRQLPHYYFRIPACKNVPSRRSSGIELRSDGQYVVAPGSVINGKSWKVTRDVKPKMLAESDLKRLSAFFQLTIHNDKVNRVESYSSANIGYSDSVPQSTNSVTESGLRRLYRHQALRIGRNNALFVSAQYARDDGWSQRRVLKALKGLHVSHPPTSLHPMETDRQRAREATATIASVYKREPRGNISRTSTQLPNSVREMLFQFNLPNVARILDGLLMLGIAGGEAFTASTIYHKLKDFGIGRNTIYSAFKAEIPSSPRYPPSDYANADTCHTDYTKQCLFGRVAKPVKNRGRPEQMIVIPTVDTLCDVLNIKRTFSDQLSPDDLRSPATYRAALHKALLQRAPGQYPRKWLAERLSISEDSCRRYERTTAICVQPVYQTWSLGWHNVDRIVPDDAPAGHFIEDESGKRYPPLLEVARRLLKRFKQVFYRRQDANHYSMPSAEQHIPLNVSIGNQSVPIGNISKSWEQSESVPIGNISKSWEQSESVPIGNISKSWGKLDKMASGERLFEILRLKNPAHSLTRKRAYELTESYGEALIERGIRLLQARSKLYNPAGYLIAWLRRQKLSSNDADSQSASETDTQHEQWVRALKESPYAAFFANADQLI